MLHRGRDISSHNFGGRKYRDVGFGTGSQTPYLFGAMIACLNDDLASTSMLSMHMHDLMHHRDDPTIQ